MKKLIEPNFEIEKSIFNTNDKYIAGVDEVGRGALAGPIVAAAVVFKKYDDIIQYLGGVKDSKLLNATIRKQIDRVVRHEAHSYSLGVVGPAEIDACGIGAANILAFKRALDGLIMCDYALIDGKKFRGFDYPYRCIEKGESKSISIAAASVIAKVYRDDLMDMEHMRYREYGFNHNKGYGSIDHFEVIHKLGPSPIHRKSFIRDFYLNEKNNKLFV